MAPAEAERVRSEDTKERYQGVNLTKAMLPEFLMSMRGWTISNASSLPAEAWNSRNGFQVSRYIDWLKDKGLVHLFSLPAFTQTMNDLGWRYKVWRINYMGESRSFKAWYPPDGFKLES